MTYTQLHIHLSVPPPLPLEEERVTWEDPGGQAQGELVAEEGTRGGGGGGGLAHIPLHPTDTCICVFVYLCE
jgi:hypothetical protein